MSKYVALRKDVCGGQLLKTGNMAIKMYDGNNNELSQQKMIEQGISNIQCFSGLVCRSMLFDVNEQGLANDLIYTTPTNYVIQGIQSKSNIESQFVINHYVELEELLKYLKYGVDLTQGDLNQIYKKLIVNRWWLNNHMELFGWIKDSCGHHSGGKVTMPMKVYRNLSWISCSKNSNPHPEEPGFSLLKKRK